MSTFTAHCSLTTPEWFFLEQGQGPPLLLLHGLGANSFSWRDNIGPLSRQFRVLAPDLPGHGLTPAAATPDFRLETLAAGLLDFLNRRGVERCAVAGNSLGGGLSLLLARERPGRFGSLVLLAPAAAVTQVPWLFLPLRLPVVGKLVAALLGPWILPFALRLAYYRRELVTSQVVAGYAPRLASLGNRVALPRLAGEVRHWPPPRLEALLRGIRHPVSLIWGEEDRILPVAQAHWLKERLPQAGFHLLPQVGHAPQEEVPELVNDLVVAFLAHSLKN